MKEIFAALAFLVVLVLGARYLSRGPSTAPVNEIRMECRVWQKPLLLSEVMHGRPDMESVRFRKFTVEIISGNALAVVRDAGQISGTEYRVSMNEDSLDLTAVISAELTLNYEINLTRSEVEYSEIYRDPFGSETIFVARGLCNDK